VTNLWGPPYAPRDDAALLAELTAVTRHHLAGCEPYAKIVGDFPEPQTLADIPFVHVGVFKDMLLRTTGTGIRHHRLLASSATTSGISSQVALDDRSGALQGESTQRILMDWLGETRAPLVILDSARAIRGQGALSARLAAALSLRPLATDLSFVLPDANAPEGLDWKSVLRAAQGPELLVYGFTWILWTAWANGQMPDEVRERLREVRVHFVHSGGWKKLESLQVDRATFEAALLNGVAPGSTVLDYYGLVEQVGMIYPLCSAGRRHVPRWGEVIARDPWTLQPTTGSGQLQLMNPLAWGAPYHSVLTEDMGHVTDSPCPCGRPGRTFVLEGRMPKAEVRGCANV
jgi:hypothetical protein